jgi:hypothetical protein
LFAVIVAVDRKNFCKMEDGEEFSGIEWPDYLVIAFYFVFVLGVGLYVRSKFWFQTKQNVKQQNVEQQNVEQQNVERQNVECQNVECQNVKQQNVKQQNVKQQNVELQNVEQQNVN